jgi:hypothetical protein
MTWLTRQPTMYEKPFWLKLRRGAPMDFGLCPPLALAAPGRLS